MKKFFKHAWLIIAGCLVITAALGAGLAGVSIENTVRRYMPENSDSYKRLIGTEEQFGSMISVGISLETKGETILTPEYLEVIRKITDQVKDLDGVNDINSITDIDYVYSLNGGLAAGQLIDEDNFTGSDEDMLELKKRITDWQEMYNRVIASDNFKAAQMAATLEPSMSSKEQIAVLHEIKRITEEAVKGTDLEVRYYGDPVLSDNSTEFMISDLISLVPLVALVVLLSLFFSFRTVSGTLLPLIAVLMATVWSCGIMALLHISFTIVASVIPVALIACGSAYGIHVITHYYAALAMVQGEMTKEKHLDAIVYGLKDVWMAVLLAGVTTIAGFISLVTSPIIPLKTFSVFTALGVLFSLVLSVTFIPAMLYVLPLKTVAKTAAKRAAKLKAMSEGEKASTKASRSGKVLHIMFEACAGTPKRLSAFSALIIVCSFIGIKLLVTDTSLVNYFPASSKFRTDIDYVDETFAGTNSLYFVISGQEKGDLAKPEILKAVDDLQNYLTKEYPDCIGKAVSFTTFIKRMNQVMHVPETEPAVAAADTGSDDAWSGDDSFDSFDSFDDFDSDESADFDSFDSFDEESDTAEAAEPAPAPVDFVDPNIAHAEELKMEVTIAEALNALHEAYSEAGGKNASAEDIVNYLERKYNFGGSDYYEIPYDTSKYPVATRDELKGLVTQYLLLYSGALDQFSDDQLAPKTIRMQVQLRTHSTIDTQKVIDAAKAFAAKNFPEGYTIEATGNGEMECSMTDMVIKSQLVSIGFSIIMVFIIIMVSFKSPLAGVLGAIPLAFTIILNFMVMGFTGIHLDLVTSIIASVAIGVGIDYTIHFLESYKAERTKSRDLHEVTLNTFSVAGKGIVTNALAVGLGFLVLVLSKFIILRYIGILVAIVMFSSSFLAMTVIPGVLNIFDPKFIRPEGEDRSRK